MRFVYIIVSCLLLSTHSYAQTNTNADLKKTIKDLGQIFKNKKKDSTAINTGTNNTTSPQNEGATIRRGNFTIITNPGELATGAKTIDADRIYPFNAGTAQVIKGSASGLIDSLGNFIVPYNTVKIMNIFVAGPVGYTINYSGIYLYNNVNANWGGYINSRGKILLKTGANNVVTDFTDNKMMVQSNNSSPKGVSYTYYAPDGKVYNSAQLIENIVDGIGIVRVNAPNQYLAYYKKITGETITGNYQYAAPFAGGMARVGLQDDYGTMKYGFIDTQGKLVVPCMFTEVPSDFSGGYAMVKPKDKSAFEYAFINKKGEIVFKQTLADIAKYGTFDHFTNYGLSFNDRYILDTNFTVTGKADFFKSFGLPADSWFEGAGVSTIGEANPKLVFATRNIRGQYTQMPVYGFINLATRKVVMPVFDFINTNGLYFDPTSHLAYAKVCLGRDNKNVPVYREGYINEDGMFVLVRSTGTTW